MNIRWLGHACFLLTGDDGVRVVTDPFDDAVGYAPPTVRTDFVSVSHEHFDHNSIAGLSGDPKVLRAPTGAGGWERVAPGLAVRTVATFHDETGGAKRGPNTVFVFEFAPGRAKDKGNGAGGFRVVHLGDLGHVLTGEQVAAIGEGADVLLVPVGGYYTIDAGQAWRVVEQLRPRSAIPMHYKTPAISFPIATAEPFLDLARRAGWAVRHVGGTSVALGAAGAGAGEGAGAAAGAGRDGEVLVLDYQ